MSSTKSILKLTFACCCLMAVALVGAYPQPEAEPEPIPYPELELALENPNPLVRHVRSPEGGSVVLTASKDQAGREASVQYNHNLYTSGNGRGSIDAYAQASRNFDYNRNNYGGGIQGRWRF